MITHIALYKLVHANAETVEEARKVLASQEGKIPLFHASLRWAPTFSSLSALTIWPCRPNLTPWKICKPTNVIRCTSRW